MNKKRLEELKEEIKYETAEEAELRKNLNIMETGDYCICRKCGESVKCSKDFHYLHELTIGNCCV